MLGCRSEASSLIICLNMLGMLMRMMEKKTRHVIGIMLSHFHFNTITSYHSSHYLTMCVIRLYYFLSFSLLILYFGFNDWILISARDVI